MDHETLQEADAEMTLPDEIDVVLVISYPSLLIFSLCVCFPEQMNEEAKPVSSQPLLYGLQQLNHPGQLGSRREGEGFSSSPFPPDMRGKLPKRCACLQAVLRVFSE